MATPNDTAKHVNPPTISDNFWFAYFNRERAVQLGWRVQPMGTNELGTLYGLVDPRGKLAGDAYTLVDESAWTKLPKDYDSPRTWGDHDPDKVFKPGDLEYSVIGLD